MLYFFLKKHYNKYRKQERQNKMSVKIKYRIQNADGTILNAGSGKDSWFTLTAARGIVNYEHGQRIIESDGIHILWEVNCVPCNC